MHSDTQANEAKICGCSSAGEMWRAQGERKIDAMFRETGKMTREKGEKKEEGHNFITNTYEALKKSIFSRSVSITVVETSLCLERG